MHFDPATHTYYDAEGRPVLYSVTQAISRFFPPFRAHTIAEAVARKRGVPKEEILSQWSAASAAGTRLHEDIHYYLNGIDVQNDSPEFHHFLRFLDDHPDFTTLRTEMVVHSGNIAGSVDCLMADKDENVILVDWKRSSKDLLAPAYGNKKALSPIKHMPDTSLSKYQLQTNLYKHLLKEGHNIEVKSMMLVQLNPEAVSYTKILVPPLPTEINSILRSLGSQ